MFLKEHIQKISLNKIKLRRTPKYLSIQEVTSVGLLFNFEEDNILETIRRAIAILDRRSIKVMALGVYIDKNSLPTENLDSRIKILDKKDFKYANVPDKASIAHFLVEKFDLYIDFTTKDFFPNIFISNAAQATFKIGRQNYKGDPFDLVLDNFKNGTSRSYLNSLIHYLSSIKTS